MKPSSVFALVKMALNPLTIPKPVSAGKLTTMVQNAPAVAGNTTSATLTKQRTSQGSPKTPGQRIGVGKDR